MRMAASLDLRPVPPNRLAMTNVLQILRSPTLSVILLDLCLCRRTQKPHNQ